tara:strand:- start:473 stop:1093 length:621 start_codon:yes stop_codon:yes gene_type:complete
MLINNQIVEINRGEIVFSQRNFAKRNNMTRQQLRTFLNKLAKAKMIEVKSNPDITHIIIVEYYTYNSFKSTQSQPRLNPIIRKKESKNKESNKDFDLFWEHYPKKVGKKKVQDKFNSNDYPIDLILKNLELQKKSDQWQNQQYIPNPETYLNQERWTDEVVLSVADDEPIYIYQCRKCKQTKTTSEYRDLYVSCCDEQIQPTKEYK